MQHVSPDTAPESQIARRRRRDIALAARAELMEKGFEGLRMRSVAERAGINIATLDYHAGGKDGLFALVAESISEDFRTQYLSTFRAEATGLERLIKQLIDFRQVRLNHPDIAPVMASLGRRIGKEPGIDRFLVPLRERWVRALSDTLALGRDDGTLRADLRPEAAAPLIIWALLGMGEPGLLRTRYPELAAELLRAYAAESSQDFEGRFT